MYRNGSPHRYTALPALHNFHLKGILEAARVGGKRSEDAGDGGTDVGAQGQRVHPVDVDGADAHEGRDGGREDRAALDQHRHTCSHLLYKTYVTAAIADHDLLLVPAGLP